MMSVALDDALSLRARGELVCARQQVSVAADLLGRLAGVAHGVLRCREPGAGGALATYPPSSR